MLDGLSLDEGVVPGELRSHSVAAGPYVGPPAEDVEYLLGRLCEWLEGPQFQVTEPTLVVPYAILKAILAHVYIEWIHPFGDGNGRLGRLVEFAILISSGAPHGAAHTLTSHYNDTRSEYYRQLQQASRNGGDLRGFLSHAVQGFVDGLRGQIEHIYELQERLMWRAVVDEHFTGRPTAAFLRQRALAITLGEQREHVLKSKVRGLTPELAVMYVDKGPKAVTRDINRLAKAGFVRQSKLAVWANVDAMLAGLRPFRADIVDPLE